MTDIPPTSTPPIAPIVNIDSSLLGNIVSEREVIDVSSIPINIVPIPTTVDTVNFKETKFNDVIITDESTNPLSANKKSVTTRLKSILLVPIANVRNADLRFVAKSIGIKGMSRTKKLEVCNVIVEWVSNPSNDKSNEDVSEDVNANDDVDLDTSSSRCRINRRRYLNVMFSDIVRPAIATKGASLTKDQLTEGLKQDQILHTLISGEYNKQIDEYAGDAFPDIEKGRYSDAGLFVPITWQKSKQTFTALCCNTYTQYVQYI